MKNIKKKIVAAGLAATMSLGAATNAFAYDLTFSDVPESFWGYTAIMAMVERGVFGGTTTPVNGVGTFSPNADMTRAAYIKTIVAYLYPDEVKPAAAGEAWYAPYVTVAKSHNLIADGEIGSDMNVAMPRQEMAMLSIRAAEAQGETVEQLIDIAKIPDYNSVDDYYKNYVREAISLGLIAGVDSKGTFDGAGKLSRAAAATVAYRLIDKSVRVVSDASNEPEPTVEPEKPDLVAGHYYDYHAENRPSKPSTSTSESAAIKALNNYLFPAYGRQFYQYGGIAEGPNGPFRFAEIGKEGGLNHATDYGQGRFFVRVFGWRKSYDSHVGTNTELNCVLEAFRYFSGDKDVAKALWKWIDAININGHANSDDYGFHDVEDIDDNTYVIAMNGVTITVHNEPSKNEKTLYFG